jgi:hypothetical protein
VIELYAITDDPAEPAPPLRAIRCDGLTALAAPAEPQRLSSDALWRHEEVVESLMEQHDLLPVRFGTLLEDESALTRALAGRGAELAAALERVRGAVELAVRARERRPVEAPPLPRDDGRAYMRAKAGRAEAARLVHDPLACLARDSVVRSGPEPLRAAYLVERDALDSFVSMVGRLQQAQSGLDILCTGPWPPYSFCER